MGKIGQDGDVGTDPISDRGGHRAAQNSRRLYIDQPLIRQHHCLQPHEVLTAIRLQTAMTHSAYVKLRRRGSIDFPIAGAAVALHLDGDVVSGCGIVLSAVASHPLEAGAAAEFMIGKRVDEETAQAAAELAAKPARPLDNADLTHFWRKRMVRVVVEQAILAATRKVDSAVKLSGT